jgi:hypothetical protein
MKELTLSPNPLEGKADTLTGFGGIDIDPLALN